MQLNKFKRLETMIYDKNNLNDEQVDKLITDNYKMDFLNKRERHHDKKSRNLSSTFNSNSRIRSRRFES